jgi:arylsulfatase A-like enzyme
MSFRDKLWMVFLAASMASAAERPNVVFFLVDDLGYSGVACYGNSLHETPHVDQLAKEGMRFTDAYTASAVCSPTRASVQSGQYPLRFGITDWIPGALLANRRLLEQPTERILPLETVTVAEAFQEGGYQTAFVGKWHLNNHDHTTGFPEDQGYEINIGGHHKGRPPGGYFAPFENPRMEDKPEDGYLTDRLGDEAIKLIEDYAGAGDEPFFLMLSFYTVHTPIQPKPELEAHYREKLKNDPNSRWQDPAYAAMVHSMDENVGRVLAALDRTGIEDDTIVVFFSDNGGLHRYTTNFPLRRSKGYYHEGGIRVPLIIRYPSRLAAGSESDQPVISNDLYPTLLDLAGLPLRPQDHKDGISLQPLLRGEPFSGHEALYWHYPHYHGAGETPSSAIRMGDYKFIRHYEDGDRELYSLREDMGETNNLVCAMPEKAAALEAKMDEWLTAGGAHIPAPNPDYFPPQPTTE